MKTQVYFYQKSEKSESESSLSEESLPEKSSIYWQLFRLVCRAVLRSNMMKQSRVQLQQPLIYLGELNERDKLMIQRKLSKHSLGLRSMDKNFDFLFLAGFMR